MEKAKLLLFQKNDERLSLLKKFLDYHKHEVVAEASSLDNCLDVLSLINIGKIAVPNAVILEGNLSTNSYQCRDSKLIISNMRIFGISSLIIGYSDQYLTENGINTLSDINILEAHDIGKNHNSLLRIIENEI